MRGGVAAAAAHRSLSAVFGSVDELLDHARSDLIRLTPHRAQADVAAGSLLVDIRPAWQREADGIVPGSLHIERNHLEWRLHPESGACIAQAAWTQRWVVLCTEGYTSSLAASALRSLGVDATDVVGGVLAWRRDGLPIADVRTARKDG